MTIVSVKIAGRSAYVLASALLAFSFSVTGCANTVNGAKQDATADTQKAATAADQAAASAQAAADEAAVKTKAAAQAVGKEAKALPEDATAAATVTPEVKTAIIRDPVLANSENLIKVSSHDHVAHLIGHVLTADMKTRAMEDAQVALAKRHPDYTVSNELTVSGGN